jgi:hypothetical protein
VPEENHGYAAEQAEQHTGDDPPERDGYLTDGRGNSRSRTVTANSRHDKHRRFEARRTKGKKERD